MALTDQLIKLLPQGTAWPNASVTNLNKTVALFSGSLQRFMDWTTYALHDSFPLNAQDTLGDWFKSFGIPYADCPPLTLAQLKIQLALRLTDCGGASAPYFVQFAKKMGYTITIVELAVPRAGLAKAGLSASYGPYADFTWVVFVADTTLSYFRVGQNAAGDPLSVGTNIDWLVWEFNRLKPSQTLIEFLPQSIFDWLAEDGTDTLLLESGNKILLDP